MDKSHSPPAPKPLFSLPGELLWMICDHLDMGELFALSTTCLCLEAIVIKNVKNRLRQQLNMNISWDEADFNVLAPLLLEPLLGKEDSRVLAPPHLDPLFGQAPANRDKYVVKALETALEEISTADTSFPYTARSRLVFNITFGDILSKADPSHWRPSGARWNPEAFRLLLRSKPTGYSTEDLGTLMDPTYLYSHLLLYDGPAHGDQGYFHDEDLPFIIAANAGFPYPSTIVHAQDFLPGLIPYPEDSGEAKGVSSYHLQPNPLVWPPMMTRTTMTDFSPPRPRAEIQVRAIIVSHDDDIRINTPPTHFACPRPEHQSHTVLIPTRKKV